MKKVMLILLVACFALAVNSCAKQKTTEEKIVGKWRLTAVQGGLLLGAMGFRPILIRSSLISYRPYIKNLEFKSWHTLYADDVIMGYSIDSISRTNNDKLLKESEYVKLALNYEPEVYILHTESDTLVGIRY